MVQEYSRRTVRYYDTIADRYLESTAAVVLEDEIGAFIKLLPPGGGVLDVACGPGHDTHYLTKRGYKCLGIDLSPEMIRVAREKSCGEFREMNFLDMSGLEEDSFDGVWCSSAFVHVRNDDLPTFIGGLSRVLKKGGILGVITAKVQDKEREPDDTREYVMYEEGELDERLKEQGFDIKISEVIEYGERERIFLIAIYHG